MKVQISKLWLCVCPSVTGGHIMCPSVCNRRSVKMIRPQDTGYYISGCWVLEARTTQSLWAAVMALTMGTNSSFLDSLYKNRQQWALTCCGLHIAKQLNSREDNIIVRVIVMDVVNSIFSPLPFYDLFILARSALISLFIILHIMYADMCMMKHNWIGCSRGRVKQGPLLVQIVRLLAHS